MSEVIIDDYGNVLTFDDGAEWMIETIIASYNGGVRILAKKFESRILAIKFDGKINATKFNRRIIAT